MINKGMWSERQEDRMRKKVFAIVKGENEIYR